MNNTSDTNSLPNILGEGNVNSLIDAIELDKTNVLKNL